MFSSPFIPFLGTFWTDFTKLKTVLPGIFKFVDCFYLTFLLPIADVHDVDIETIGYISGIPPVCALLAGVAAPVIADYLRNKNVLSVSNVSDCMLWH